MDIFEKLRNNRGPLGKLKSITHGYFSFPKLEGEISNWMYFRGKKVLQWSLNNYLALANHPDVRKTDAEAAKKWGLGYPMGSRMMSGNTKYHEKLEKELANFVKKEDAILLNYGYQGMFSAIDCLLGRNDVVIYDSEAHACIVDGVRLHQGKRFVYPHNDIQKLEKQLQRASKIVNETGGGILVITEGVFGMSGDQAKLKEITALKNKYQFRIFLDDAHGFGTMGPTGAGTSEEQNVQNEIDIHFGTFAKAMGSIGAFIASDENVIDYLRYNMRSQIFAKSMPIALVIGNLKRLELLKTRPEIRKKLWTIAKTLQKGLKDKGFDIGTTNSQITPVFLKGGKAEAANIIIDLRENFNIFCSGVIYPVVPKGVVMLRIIPTAMHTIDDVNYTLDAFSKIKEKLLAGEYKEQNMPIENN